MIIAIDGPAGSGKSTISKLLTKELGFIYLDTGAMYRLFTLKMLKEKISFSDSSKINELLEKLNINIENDRFYKDVILDGRDIGTVVFPNADLKIFLVADPKERAERRFKELQEKGENISLDNIYENILKRDRLDSTREISPLKKANDAIEVDTTGKNIEEVKNLILSLYRNKKNIGK